jgi:phosphatidylethanolamine-binding protein (PEBP) family uncharacterized protein
MKTHGGILESILAFGLLTSFGCAPASEPVDSERPGSGGNGAATGGKSGTGGSSPSNTGGSAAGGSGGSSAASGGTSGSSGGAAGTGSGGSEADGSGGGANAGGTGGASSGGSSGSDGGGSSTPDAADGDTATPPGSGEFTFTGDFEMKGDRLCFKKGATRSTGQKSPELKWTGTPPAGTLSFAVSLYDTSNMGTHWVIWNLPPTATGLPAGLPGTPIPANAMQSNAWYGPGAGAPPHKYEYKLWPLKVAMLPGGDKANMRTKVLPMNVIGMEKTITAWGDQNANCGP